MVKKRVGFSSFPITIPLPPPKLLSTSSFPTIPPLVQTYVPTQTSSSLLLMPPPPPPPSASNCYNSTRIVSNQLPNLNNNRSPSRKRKRDEFDSDGTKKLIPFTEMEWKYVQRRFMNEDHQTLMELTNIMNMWLCRMWHDTPVFISISELVLRALVLDQKRQSTKGNTGLDNADVGLILGSVIIRFVNYVAEICQTGFHKLSIKSAVGKMDIPPWIVTIRHQATHGQMPPMNMLKEAIKFCRKWLWFQHWSKPLTDAIKQALPGTYEEQLNLLQTHLVNRMQNALQRFREWRRTNSTLTEFPLNDSSSATATSSSSSRSIRNILENLIDSDEKNFIAFFAISCLACKIDDTIELVGIDEDDIFVINNNNNIIVIDEEEEDILTGNLFSQEKHVGIISVEEQLCYSPIFNLMNSKGILHCLMLEIIRLVSNDDELPSFESRKHMAGWAEILLDAYIRNPTTISFQDWRTIIRYFVKSPQFFKSEQIESLLDILNDGLSKKCKTRLQKLFNIRDKINNINEDSTSLNDLSIYSIKTLGDLHVLQNQMIQAEENPDSTFICDPLTMEDDWSIALPNELGNSLGLTFDQNAETLCLALNIDMS